MKILTVIFCLLGIQAFAVTPINELKLQSNANGGGYSVTNLTDVVLTNGIRLSTVGSAQGTVTGGLSTGSSRITITNAAGQANLKINLDVTGLATGTPLYVETYTGSVGSVDGLATGTPLYVESFAGTVTGGLSTGSSRLTITNSAGQSNLKVNFDATGLATGTPLYAETYTGSVGSVAGLATGTPVYSVTRGGSSSTRLTVSNSTGPVTIMLDATGLATGTPLYAETYTGNVGVVGSAAQYASNAPAFNASTIQNIPVATNVGANFSVLIKNPVSSVGYAPYPLSKDVTMGATGGVTIADSAVTWAKMDSNTVDAVLARDAELASTSNNIVAFVGAGITNQTISNATIIASVGLVSTNLSGVSNRLSIAESNYVGRSGVQTMQGPLNVASNIYAVANLGSELVNDGGFAIGGGTTSTTYRLTGGAQWNNSGASEGILILDGTSGTFSQTGQINHVIGPTYSNGIDVANAWTGSLSIADGGETITFALTTTGHLSWLSSYRVVSNAVFTMSSTNGTGKLDNYTSKRFTVGDGYFVNLHAENITATNITGAGAFLVANDITNKVNKTGDTMTGPLTNRASVWASEFRVLGNSYGDTNSFAEGRSNSVQSGPEIVGAFARGLKNTARGDSAFVDGYENFSDSDVSFISGASFVSTNHGLNSVILGGGGLNLIQSNTAAGLIFGDHNTIYDSSEFAFAWGEDVQVSGDHAVAIGRACQSLASRSFTMGNNAGTTNGGAFVFKDSSEGFVNSESNDQFTIVFTNGFRIISGTNVTRLGGPVPTVNGNAISGGGSSLGLFSNATAIAGGITNIHLNGSFTASATGQEAWVNFVDTTGAGGGGGLAPTNFFKLFHNIVQSTPASGVTNVVFQSTSGGPWSGGINENTVYNTTNGYWTFTTAGQGYVHCALSAAVRAGSYNEVYLTRNGTNRVFYFGRIFNAAGSGQTFMLDCQTRWTVPSITDSWGIAISLGGGTGATVTNDPGISSYIEGHIVPR